MYDKYLTVKSIFGRASTLALLLLFFVIRIASYLLMDHLIIQGIIVFVMILLLGILYFKNPHWAWYLVIGEIFLGGSGHFFELGGLAIRTLFVLFFVFLWVAEQIGKNFLMNSLKINRNLIILLGSFFILVIVAVINGLYQGHSLASVIQSSASFIFLILIFPSYHLFRNSKSQERLIRLIIVFIVGTAFFSLFMFIWYSGGWGILQDNFYRWYRDIAGGKITNMGSDFFRIVEPEHLLLTPIILFICSLLMRDEKHNIMWRLILILAIIPLMLNFSRSYFLAFLLGLLVLKYKHKWKRWIIVSSTTILLMLIVFTSTSFLASGGTTAGLELFGVRVVSLVNPQVEVSTATRMMILPAILDLIKLQPILGSGFGAEVTFMNTLNYEQITTTQFDWGYLQLWVELGIFGLLFFLGIIFFAFIKLIKKIRQYADYQDPDVGLLAGLVAFLFMTITMPAFYHVFGIIFLMLVLATSVKPVDSLSTTVTLLYRIFNRLKSPNDTTTSPSNHIIGQVIK